MSLKIKETIESVEKKVTKTKAPMTKASEAKTAEPKKIVTQKASEPKESKSKNNAQNTSAYGTGKRKDAIARVWVKIGSGKIDVNNKLLDQYFSNDAHKIQILKPFALTDSLGQYDVFCTVKGGGSSGQAGAIRHGISKGLNILAPEFHKILRENGLLTRDSRVVERKKYGKHKARKSTQFSKR
jgi:small subunit ribosomal protein S9